MVNPIINHRYWYRDNRKDNIHWSHPLNIKPLENQMVDLVLLAVFGGIHY
jgi:hypothetical protein